MLLKFCLRRKKKTNLEIIFTIIQFLSFFFRFFEGKSENLLYEKVILISFAKKKKFYWIILSNYLSNKTLPIFY